MLRGVGLIAKEVHCFAKRQEEVDELYSAVRFVPVAGVSHGS